MRYYEVAILKSKISLIYCSNSSVDIGNLVEITIKNRKKKGVVLKEVEKPDFKTENLVILDEYLSLFQLELAYFIKEFYVCTISEAISLFVPFRKNIEEVKKDFDYNLSFNLTEKQKLAREFLLKQNISLLFANTGSGKTEIYISIIKDYLKENKQVLFLMPEISLTPMIEERLKKEFNSNIAIWHSKLTKKQKENILEKIYSKEILLIAGARSALFLPLDNLGLIIVDEEHDNSYKSNSSPYYNAKDLSIYIGKKYNKKIILGSATPSINSFYKLPYFRLKETFFKTKKEITFHQEFDEYIFNEIQKTINRDKQVLFFVPTRANYKYQVCDNCFNSIKCPNCSVSLSLHKKSLALKCHYCNYTTRIPDICPYCQNGIIKNYRIGTAEVEEKLKERFQNVERFDRDKITTTKKLYNILNKFNNKEIDILVGTQMLTKGHNYHNIELVVILGIDFLLNIPSYNARVEAISTLFQTIGRGGRSGYSKILIISKHKELLSSYLNSDYQDFLEEELEFRKGLYPPFKRIATIIFSHKNKQKAYDEMMKNYLVVSKFVEARYKEADIFMLKSKYRYELFIRDESIKKLIQTLHLINSPIATINIE